MPGVYAVTGRLGSGKTLVCVGKIKEYLLRGRRVCTNLNLRLELLLPKGTVHQPVLRLPDFPRSEDFMQVGIGNPSKDESQNGLLVLDEAGGWLNSRGWQDKDRQEAVVWLLNARKLGWDIMFIVQSLTLIDKQVREAFCEHHVICRRLDRFNVPYLGALLGWFGGKLKLPQVHIANVFYGTGVNSAIVDRWIYRGRDLWAAYDTRQRFFSGAVNQGVATIVPPAPTRPWLSPGAYLQREATKSRLLRRVYDWLRPMTVGEQTYRDFRVHEELPPPHYKPSPRTYREWLASIGNVNSSGSKPIAVAYGEAAD